MNKRVSLILFILIGITLVACGQSTKDKVIGDWKLEHDGEIGRFLDITEDNLTFRFPLEKGSETVDYIVTETIDDHFMVEVSEPGSGSNTFLFEGYFEAKDKIVVVEAEGGEVEDLELVRIDSIAEEQERLAIAQEKRQEQEKREQEKEEREQEKLEAETNVSAGENAYRDSCMSCHGEDLEGVSGPGLQNISSTYTRGEIKDIIFNGIGGMPAQAQIDDDVAEAIAEWLHEEH